MTLQPTPHRGPVGYTPGADPLNYPVTLPRNRAGTVIGLFYSNWIAAIALALILGGRLLFLAVVIAGAITGMALTVVVLTKAGDQPHQARPVSDVHVSVSWRRTVRPEAGGAATRGMYGSTNPPHPHYLSTSTRSLHNHQGGRAALGNTQVPFQALSTRNEEGQ